MDSKEIDKDPFTAYEDILCRDGVKRRIYPAKLKHKDKIRELSPKFNDMLIAENILDINSDGEYTDEAWDAMLDVLVMAFDDKYTKEQIMDFLDVVQATKVFEVFYGISNLKKKRMTLTMV